MEPEKNIRKDRTQETQRRHLYEILHQAAEIAAEVNSQQKEVDYEKE